MNENVIIHTARKKNTTVSTPQTEEPNIIDIINNNNRFLILRDRVMWFEAIC